MTRIEKWLVNNMNVEAGSYKDLTENMERQCPMDIAGSYRDWDPTQPADWVSRILFSFYLENFDQNSKVLDIGFGDGWPSLLIAPEVGEVVGIDIAEQRVRKAQENQKKRGITNVQFFQMSSEEMEFADNTFDGAFSCSCLEQTDSFATVKELYRVLKPGGTIVGSVQDLTQFPPGEYLNRMAPEAFMQSTHGDYIYIYSIYDVENLEETNYIIYVTEKLDQLIAEGVAPGYAHLTEEQSLRLGQLLEEHSADLLRCITYTTHHLSIPKMEEYLQKAGFSQVSIFTFTNLGQIKKIIRDWKESGKLEEMSDHFNEITMAFKDLLGQEETMETDFYHIYFKAIK